MNPTVLMFSTKVRLWRHWVFAQAGRPGRSLLTFLVLALIWGILFAAFRAGFVYAQFVYRVDVYVISGLFGVFFMLVMLLVVLTSVVLTQFGLYQSREAELLMVLPIAPARAALYRSAELCIVNSLGALYVSTPMVVAYAVVEEVSVPRIALALGLLVPLLVIPNCVGVCATVGVRRLAGRVPTRLLMTGGICILLALFYGMLATFDFGIFEETEHPVRLLNQMADALSGTRRWFLPSFWYVEAVFSPVRGHPRMTWWFGGILGTAAAAALLGWVATLRYLYYASWLAGSGGATAEVEPARRNRLAEWATALRPLPSASRTLLAKDMLLFVREPVVRTQGLVMLGLLFVYFASLPSLYSGLVEEPLQKHFISLVNFGALGLLLSAFACRFLLPLLSREGRQFWLLRTAPPKLGHILFGEWGFGAVVLLVLGQPLLGLSNYMTSMDRVFVAASHAGLVGLAVAIAALAIGVGAAFPDLQTGGRETGAAATLAFLGCLVMIAAFLVAMAVPYLQYVLTDGFTYATFVRRLVHNIVGVSCVSAGCGLLVLVVGHGRLSQAEVP